MCERIQRYRAMDIYLRASSLVSAQSVHFYIASAYVQKCALMDTASVVFVRVKQSSQLTRPGSSGAIQPGLPISMFDQSCHYSLLSHPYSVSTSISRV